MGSPPAERSEQAVPENENLKRILANAHYHLSRLAALTRPMNRQEERMHDAFTALIERSRGERPMKENCRETK